jgi:L-2-hydroxyglutarate oxidase LhgO
MSLYSIDFFKNWDFDCGYEPRGYLFFATDDEQLNYLKRNVEKQKSLGVKAVEIVDTQTISEIVKGLNCEDIRGGSFGATTVLSIRLPC